MGPFGFMTSILSKRTFHPTNEDYVQSESPQQRFLQHNKIAREKFLILTALSKQEQKERYRFCKVVAKRITS